MDLNKYQEEAKLTSKKVIVDGLLAYPAMGLVGEAGEVINKVKKIWRDDGGVVTPERRQEIVQELGDVLWYVAEIASSLNVTLEEVAEYNLKKLQSREDRKLISGDGDNR